MQRMIRSGSALLVALALVGLVFPLQALASTARLDRLPQRAAVLHYFATGARMLAQPSSGHDEHLQFRASNGDGVNVYLDVLEGDIVRATVEEMFSLEIDTRAPTKRSGAVWLLFDGQRIDMSDPTLLSQEDLEALQGLGQAFEATLSPSLRDELEDASAELVDGLQRVAAGQELALGGDPDLLISKSALDCGASFVGYLGSIVSFAVCVTIIGCLFAVVFHYAAIYSTVSSCVGWIEERAAERLAGCEDDDPDTPCNAE